MKFLKKWDCCRGLAEKFILFGLMLQLTSAIQLEGLVTKKPRTSKYTMKPQIATESPSTISVYRVNATSGNTCMLMRTDGLLTIKYRNKLNEDMEADVYLPDYPDLSGVCDDNDEAQMTLKFKGFVITFYFEKTPGGERWYCPLIELSYSSSNPYFEHPDRPNLNVKLSTQPHTFLFATPSGKSFECMNEQEIVMYSLDENDRSGHIAKLLLRDTRMQSFMFRANGQWGPPYVCTASGTYRDESAPFIMGTILGLISVGIVVGYAVYRWKVKKYEYGNMA